MYRGRLILAGRKKLILSLLGIFGLCWVIFGTSLISQLVTFCLSGAVPGTDYVISAGTILGLTVAAGGLLAFLGLVQLLRSHVQSRTLVRHKRMMELLRRTVPQQPASRHIRRGRFAYPTLSTGLRLRLWLATLLQRVADPLNEMGFAVKEFMRDAGTRLLVFLARFMLMLVVGLAMFGHLGLRIAGLTKEITRHVWHWAEPRLWQVDGWLETQVKNLRKKVSLWLVGYAPASVLQTIWQENSANLKKWRQVTLPESSQTTDSLEIETDEINQSE